MGCWSFITKVIALVLAFMFISVMCTTIWMINIQNTAFQSETYVDTLAEHGFYENVVPLILPAIAAESEAAEATEGHALQSSTALTFHDVVVNLDQDDWNEIAEMIVPPAYLQEQAERNMNNLFAYINGERLVLDIRFDMSVILNNLRGEPGQEIIQRIIDSWETCSPTEEAQLQRYFAGDTVEFPYCAPDEDTRLYPQVVLLLTDARDELISEIPEQWDVREQMAIDEGMTLREVDQQLYNDVQAPRIAMQNLYPLAFLMPCAFLALIVIVTVRSSKSFFAWMGWTIATSGLLALLPLGLIPFIMSSLYSSSPDQSNMDAIQAEALRGIVRSLIGDFTMPILLMGAGLAIIGFIFLFISILLHDPDLEDAAAYAAYAPTGSMPGLAMPSMPGSSPSLSGRTPPPAPPRPPVPPQPSRPQIVSDDDHDTIVDRKSGQ